MEYHVKFFYSHLKKRTASPEQTTVTPAITATGSKTFSPVSPRKVFFISAIPCVKGKKLTHFCITFGITSTGSVVPEKISIGKYRRLVATFIDFAVRHRAATRRPIENIETIVSSHTPAKASTLPLIRCPEITAAAVRIIVEMTAIILLERISQKSSLKGEHGLQYILLRIP